MPSRSCLTAPPWPKLWRSLYENFGAITSNHHFSSRPHHCRCFSPRPSILLVAAENFSQSEEQGKQHDHYKTNIVSRGGGSFAAFDRHTARDGPNVRRRPFGEA